MTVLDRVLAGEFNDLPEPMQHDIRAIANDRFMSEAERASRVNAVRGGWPLADQYTAERKRPKHDTSNGEAAPVDLPNPVDWAALWATETTAEWMVEPLIATGRAHALYAPAKAGKSLLLLELAAALATGRGILGRPPGPPVPVGYFDYEMTEADLRERLEDMGYGPDDALDRLRYYVQPGIPPLDQPEGGRAVLDIVHRDALTVVMIDTTGRAVEGAENDADTIRGYYRWTGSHLRAAGITTVRADHAGKNLELGQRGTSAKNDDVDIVWQLTADHVALTLRATHRRVSWIPPLVMLRRVEEPTLHHVRTDESSYPAGTAECAGALDQLGVPLDATTRAAQNALRNAERGARRAVVIAAQRFRNHSVNARPEP